jgi:hypothetical protein
MLWLIVGIPASAVLMGVVTAYLAFSQADPGIHTDAAPLSKTSWRQPQ